MSSRERPIRFADAMVRAVLEDRKTQTRRLLKPQPAPNSPHDGGTTWVFNPKTGLHVPCGTVGHLTVREKLGLRCPYGGPGDRLWVRQCWYCDVPLDDPSRAEHLYYSVDSLLPLREACCDLIPECQCADVGRTRWRPSIYMPRWASRLTLEVTAVRVERLQDITEANARAEGAQHFADIPVGRHGASARWSMEAPADTDECLGSARMAFGNYINKLHGGPRWNCSEEPTLWNQNPWVWVVEFRRVESTR